jgi:hypothetical protein
MHNYVKKSSRLVQPLILTPIFALIFAKIDRYGEVSVKRILLPAFKLANCRKIWVVGA